MSIMVMGKANGKMVDPTPIEKIEENLTFMTASKKLAYLNTTKGWADASYNLQRANTPSKSTQSSDNVDNPLFSSVVVKP